MSSLILSPITPGSLPLSPGQPGSLFIPFWAITNVTEFGAKGDGVQDDYQYIMNAYNSIPSRGGWLYLPPGQYKHGTALSFTDTKPVGIIGGGQFASTLKPSFAAGDAITVNGPAFFQMQNIGIVPTIGRTSTAYNVSVKNCSYVSVDNVYANNGVGGLFSFDTCTFVQMASCQGQSNVGANYTAGGTCLRLKASSGMFSNLEFRTTGGSPCLWITGTATSMDFTGCHFGGGGPVSSFAVTSITSDASKFTVTTSATHDFQVGDFIVLRGMTPSAYNDVWRVSTVPTGTTLTVATSANPGSSSVNGTAESLSACGYVSNAAGAVNEASFGNCLFYGWTPPTRYGEVGLYFDGRRGVALSKAELSGWRLNGNYYDYGSTGLLISGDKGDAANEPTANGFSVNGAVFVQQTRGLHIDQAVNVTADSLVGSPSVAPVSDGISSSAALYVYAGPSAPFSQGIVVSSSTLGAQRNYSAARNPYAYGVILDSPGIQDLKLSGCQLNGSTGQVSLVNSPRTSSSRWQLADSIDQGPIAYGLNGWTYHPGTAGNGIAPSSQTVYFGAVYLRAGDVVNNLWCGVCIAAVGTVPTTIKMALLDASGNRLAVTGNLNNDAKWTSIGHKSFAVSSPYTVLTTGVYMVAFLKDGAFGTTDVGLVFSAGNQNAKSALNGTWVNGNAGTGLTDIGVGPLTFAGDTRPFWFATSL